MTLNHAMVFRFCFHYITPSVRLNCQQALLYNSALIKLNRLEKATQKWPCLAISSLYRILNLLDGISCFFSLISYVIH